MSLFCQFRLRASRASGRRKIATLLACAAGLTVLDSRAPAHGQQPSLAAVPQLKDLVDLDLEQLGYRPDVAILDIGMPGMTGYDVATQIRQTDWGRDALLIALTGWGQRDDVHRAHMAGFDHHMTKPADFATLQRMIDVFAAARAREAAKG